MQKKIVILGGVGFIGSHLCLRLLDEECELFCVDTRNPADSPLLRTRHGARNFHYVRHNIVHRFGIRCDEIYNLAAPPMLRYDRALPADTLKTAMEGSVNALDTARAEHARVVYASSGDIYESSSRELLTDLCHPFPPKAFGTEGKRSAEALHRAYAGEFGVDVRIARIFGTYGSGCDLNDQRAVTRMVVAALRNRDITIYGSGEQTRTFCWVGDIVDGLVRLMRAAPSDRLRIVDLGSTHEITIRALAEKIVELTGSRSRIVHTEARRDDARRKTPDIGRAQRELEWSPHTSLTEGLQRTIAYVEKELAGMSPEAMSWIEVH